MATTEEIKKTAILVRDATQIGENTAERVGGVLVDLANKSKELEDKIKAKAEKSEVATELDKKFDKENIAQEFGDSEDKVVSQFALPFREIESPEFIKVIVDAEEHFLFGIQLDGSIEWGKGIPTPIRAKLEEIITQCRQDKTDLLESINTLNGILDKTTIKDEEGNVQDTPFRVIENEEFIMAVVDSEDRLLFGIFRATGKPYFPLNEMYHVEQNEEFFAVWLDAANHVLLGIRRDGEIIGEIHAVNALKQVVSQLQSDLASLQEKVGTIDTNLKEFLGIFSLQDNDEYLAVEQDAEGKILSATNPDGSHYIHYAKSETIPTEFSHIEDHNGRTEITTDAEDKILGYRDSKGTRHEYKISTKHLELSDEAAKEVNEAFKSAGIKMENPSDFSKDSHIELPIPRIAAQVRIYAPKLPTTKQDDIEAEIEYNDKDGNYFRKPVILNTQGQSSMYFYVKNMAIDINDGSDIKFGDFPAQDSFHLKKYYVDNFRGQCIVGYWLMEQVYKSHPIGQQYPYESILTNNSTTNGIGKSNKDFFTGAKCHPDGFPIIITWINQSNGEETLMGVYAWNLKKSKEVYYADKKKTENIILDGIIGNTEIWGGKINWTQFEIRNPKSLKDINENKYDGDNPKELSDTDTFSKSVKVYITHLSEALTNLKSNQTKEEFEKYFLVNPFIDYFLVSQVLYNWDGFNKNWIWCTWDGLHWTPTLYDVDLIFGLHANGISVKENSDTSEILGISMDLPSGYLNTLYSTEIAQRYKELRDANIFNVINITDLLSNWLKRIGYKNIKEEFNLYDQTPSYRASNTSDKWKYLYWSWSPNYPTSFSDTKTYSKGELVYYYGGVYEALEETTGVPPTTKLYTKYPEVGGCYNSLQRVANWIENRIDFLDKTYNYK